MIQHQRMDASVFQVVDQRAPLERSNTAFHASDQGLLFSSCSCAAVNLDALQDVGVDGIDIHGAILA